MKTINVKLSPHGVADAINELLEYQKDVKRKAGLLVQNLMDFGTDIARIKIVSLGAIDSGDLLSGVSGYYSPALNAGFVRVISDHVAFVEFGTGVTGLISPHKNGEYLAKSGWQYNVGTKIFVTKDGEMGWIYPTDDGGFRFTDGMPSRPFMYETALGLQRIFPMVAKDVFST